MALLGGDTHISNLQGGGVCAFINGRWCKNISVVDKVCNETIEYMTLSLRPFYLPREFNKIIITVVYIPPGVDVKLADHYLYKCCM